MATATIDSKRQNFNITPEQEAELTALQTALSAPSMKDALLRAARLVLLLEQEIKQGRRVYFGDAKGNMTRAILPDLERVGIPAWKYLVERPGSWKRQLFFKGRKLTAAQVWLEMQTNQMTPQEAAENWDLPLEAVEEAVRYCETNRDLIGMEAAEERLHLVSRGVAL